MLILAFLILGAVFIYFKRKRSRIILHANGISKKNERSEMKPLPGHSDLLLDTYTVDGLLHSLYKISDTYMEEGIFYVWLGPMKFVIIYDPSLIEAVSNCPNAQSKGEFYQIIFGSIANGAFAHPGGPEWKELRKPIVQSMSKKYLDNEYFNIFIFQSHRLIDFLKEKRAGKCHNLGRDVNSAVFDTFSSTHMGVHTNELGDRGFDLSEMAERKFMLSLGDIMLFHYFFWQFLARLKKISLKVIELMTKLILSVTRNPEQKKSLNEDDNKSFMDSQNKILTKKWWISKYFDEFFSFLRFKIMSYMNIYNNTNLGFTKAGRTLLKSEEQANKCIEWLIEERRKCGMEDLDGIEYYTDFLIKRGKEHNFKMKKVFQELADVIAAGSDTTPAVVNSALLYIAMHPEVQERAFREQEEIFGDSDRDPTLEDLAKMDYLERVIKETLRFIAPPGVLKVTDGPCVIGNYEIPKACVLYIYLRKVHSSPKYYEKPLEFYPDHFLPEVEAKRPRYAYIPFGVGSRKCPGFQYAAILMKVMISMILRSFTLKTPLTMQTIQYEYRIMLNVKGGFPLELEKRLK